MNFPSGTYQFGKYEVTLWEPYRGYFEHNEYGEDAAGGLWFERTDRGIELVDYDGVYELPKAVATGLVSLGFNLDEILD